MYDYAENYIEQSDDLLGTNITSLNDAMIYHALFHWSLQKFINCNVPYSNATVIQQ